MFIKKTGMLIFLEALSIGDYTERCNMASMINVYSQLNNVEEFFVSSFML